MKKEIDMTSGNIFINLLLLIYPVIITNTIQRSYNIINTIVVGRFSGVGPLAAVGATASIVNIIISILSGFSIGVHIIVSRYYGAKSKDKLSDVIHTSIASSISVSVIFTIIIMAFSRKILMIMNTPYDILDDADAYLKIFYLGLPAMFLSESEIGILRGIGNTKTPMYYLGFSGLVNVILNIILVAVLKLNVIGAAIAGTTTQYIFAFMCTYYLSKCDGLAYQLKLKKIKIDFSILKNIFSNGIPASVQSTLCSMGGAFIQIYLNSLGSKVLAATSAAVSIQNIVFGILVAVYTSMFTAVSQNYGAKDEGRIKQILAISILFDVVVGLVIGAFACNFRYQLMHIFVTDNTVIEIGATYLMIITLTLCLNGVMDIFSAFYMGMSMRFIPIISTLIGQLGISAIWGITLFAYFKSFMSVVWIYPVMWAISILIYLVSYTALNKKMFAKMYSS